jgi:tRNA G26 N,N-dimethylase Trm1
MEENKKILERLLQAKVISVNEKDLIKRDKKLKKLHKMLEGQNTKNTTFFRADRHSSVTQLQKHTPRHVVEKIEDADDISIKETREIEKRS